MSGKARVLKNGMHQYDTKDLIIRDDIMEKAKELAALISTSTEVQYYKKAEMQIRNNDHVQSLIKQIKKKQKEAVAFEKTFRNPEMVKKIEGEIEALQNELDGIPIVSQFQQTQHDINYLLQMVMGVVRDTVSQKIEVEQAQAEEPANCSD
ncbi:Protein of uncharacterised function (DUF964) [Chlamydia abortus]|uniref:RicAFT regulatory complex protein RicA family protein n=1 Tax=Paenibacillus residui TaxID=629724 RepID=A0ABW3D9Z5_9BACL|nr:Protein of uncharacterised function (DUF964) [Chlamydia abortus]